MSVLSATPETTGEPRRKLWTSEEVTRLREKGFFEGRRYELIDGELIDKMGRNPPHPVALQLLCEFLIPLFGIRRVRTQTPIEVRLEDQSTSEPEPDLAVTRGTATEYRTRHPLGSELVLLVEVSDSTARMDRVRKSRVYAARACRNTGCSICKSDGCSFTASPRATVTWKRSRYLRMTKLPPLVYRIRVFRFRTSLPKPPDVYGLTRCVKPDTRLPSSTPFLIK